MGKSARVRTATATAAGAVGAALALVLTGCSQSLDDATAQYCENLDVLQTEVADLELIVGGDATVDVVDAQREAVRNAYEDLRDSAGDVNEAVSGEIDDAYDAYQDELGQIPGDATLSEAAPLYAAALESYTDALAEVANDAGCEDA